MADQIRWWRNGSVVAIFALVWGLVLLLTFALFIIRGQREAAGVGGVLGVLTTVVGVITPLVGRHLERSAARRKGEAVPLSENGWRADATERLVATVLKQWKDEARLRRLRDRWPLPVSWKVAEDLTDPEHAVPAYRADAERTPSQDVSLDGDLDEAARIFEGIPSRRLVVLGPEGSGKSVLALVLVLDLLARRQPGGPVPVLMPLSSWDPATKSLDEWLVMQLSDNYQLRSADERDSRIVAARLVRDNLILPILDGLDEVSEHARPDAVDEINGWLGDDRGIILTSRVREYQTAVEAGDVITRAAAITLQPLTLKMVEGYLISATPPPRKARWEPVFAEMARDPQGAVASALRTPLMVALARVIYGSRPGDPQVLLESRFAGRAQIEEHLLSELIPATYPAHRRSEQPAVWRADQVQVWLTSLARNFGGQGQPDIAWWQLEEAVPPAVVRMVAALAGAVVLGFVFGLVAGLVFAAAALALGATRRSQHWSLEGLLAVRVRRLTATARRQDLVASLIGLGERAPLERRFALGVGRVLALAAGLIVGFLVYQSDGLYKAVAQGLGVGLAVGLADGYLTVAQRSGLSEVGFVSRRGAAAFLRHVAIGFVTGVGAGVAVWAISASWFGVLVGILVGLAFGLIDGLNIWLDVSTDVTRALSPDSTRRAERIAAFARSLTIGTTLLLTTGIAYTFAYGISAAVLPALVFGLGYALADRHMGLATSVWGRYIAAKTWLALSGQVPWRFMSFLRQAHLRGLLRRVGPYYQFRHARLQEYLARRPTDPLPESS